MPISCNLYDTIEIVCMFHYPVTLTLVDGQLKTGIARDTKRNAENEECIELDIEGESTLVVLSQLDSMQVNIENPHLGLVKFR